MNNQSLIFLVQQLENIEYIVSSDFSMFESLEPTDFDTPTLKRLLIKYNYLLIEFSKSQRNVIAIGLIGLILIPISFVLGYLGFVILAFWILKIISPLVFLGFLIASWYMSKIKKNKGVIEHAIYSIKEELNSRKGKKSSRLYKGLI